MNTSRRNSVALFSGSTILLVDKLASPREDIATRTEGGASDPPRHTIDLHGLFHGECFERQLKKPKVPYPAWDYDWDGLGTTNADSSHPVGLVVAKRPNTGKTRHVLLIRHGQYEQGFRDDSQQVLTPLGRRQAELTGQRLAKMMAANSNLGSAGEETDTFSGPCSIKSIHVSGMTRAKETAFIIASQLKDISDYEVKPDPLLNEALPAPIIPMRPDVGTLEAQAKEIDENHDRIETVFQKYIHRAYPTDPDGDDCPEHDFEVIVCHANIIRYFLLRSLQLPPEAWLRFSLFNCSITYLMIQPNGYVTVRLVGDTGHIPYEETTFSGAYGYNWRSPTST
jgi:serine/threonine-protein phosphatase PGAM5